MSIELVLGFALALALRDHLPGKSALLTVLLIPMMLALAYMAQFVIIVPLYYRYRYPLEPVIAVLIGVSLARVAEVGLRSLGAVLPGRRQVSAEQAPHAVHTPVAPIQHAGRQSHAPS